MHKSIEKVILGLKQRNGTKVPVVDLIKGHAGEAALISKVRKDTSITAQYDNNGEKRIHTPDIYNLRTLSESIALSSNDSENILKLLPDMDLTVQILVSMIISPSDMMKNEIMYVPPDNIVNSSLASTLIDVIKAHFKKTYDLNAKLPEILKDIVALSGSYPICILPENSLDDLINGKDHISTESLTPYTNGGFFKPMGFLSLNSRKVTKDVDNYSGIALESLRLGNGSFAAAKEEHFLDVNQYFKNAEQHNLITITDNFNVLKVPLLNEIIREQYVEAALEAAGAGDKLTDRDLAANIYRSNQANFKEVEVVKSSTDLKRHSIGNALIMKLPPESVKPVHVPGNPKQHVGYYVILDEYGYPVSKLTSPGYKDQLAIKATNGADKFSQAMTEKVNRYMNSGDFSNASGFANRQKSLAEHKAYAEIIDAQLLAKLKNGMGAGGVELANNDEIYRVMLARQMAGQRTQILFVPIEFMSYLALRYNEEGIGQSLTEFNSTLLSMRVMLMFSNLMCSVNNSIARRVATIHYDEKDPNPEKTLEMIMGEIVRGRQNTLPLNLNTPADIVDWINRASIEFAFDGHPKFPDLKVDITEKASSLAKPDMDLETELKKRSQMGFSVPPENVDAAWGPEFARSVTNQNIITAKRVLQIQQEFVPQLTSLMRKIALHSEELIGEMIKVISDNVGHVQLNEEAVAKITPETKTFICRRVAQDFIKGLETKLPEPITTTSESNFDNADGFNKLLDIVMDAWIPEEGMVAEVMGGSATNVKAWKANIKGYFMRQWMAQNAIMPELAALVTDSKDTNERSQNAEGIWKEISEYQQAIATGLLKAEVHASKIKKISDAITSKINPEGQEGQTSDEYGNGGGGETGAEGSGEENPLGGEEDLSGIGEPEQSETPESTEPTETPAETPEETPEENKEAVKNKEGKPGETKEEPEK